MAKPTDTNINSGHRSRMREKYLREGNLDSFHDHEVLEMLLFQYLPFKDTNKLAHRLVNKFGSLSGVLNATHAQLVEIEGISSVTATNLALLKDVWQRCRKTEKSTKRDFSSLSQIVKFAQEIFGESRFEEVIAVFLDHATQYIGRKIFTSNSLDYVAVSPKEIVKEAILSNAAGVLLFHGHIKGNVEPSTADMQYTEQLNTALTGLNIVFLDHIILNDDGGFFSFRQNGKLRVMNNE